jgi:hypothetical protein
MPITLPVHQLSPAPTDSATMEEISPAILFGLEGVELDEASGSIVGRTGAVTVELDRASSGTRAADSEHLAKPSRRPALPGAKRAYAPSAVLSRRPTLLRRFDDGAPFVFPRLDAGGTAAARGSRKRRTRHALDVQARYALAVRNPGKAGMVAGERRLPAASRNR